MPENTARRNVEARSAYELAEKHRDLFERIAECNDLTIAERFGTAPLRKLDAHNGNGGH
ncbi:hypothetical protein [Halobaculum magnesiiphilum]|uniref:Uncharacterized protein n=1 Tax=Halobaculum magnesiiphilum TaxID=1017351 RepID=A0A8T8WHD6_9EURY|nr:hypothetical protein [Halobaculum magnesiiphilum]QZP39196.1 hypothetical protein K6T50_16170 [Halobaculum magnesiiphilum]